LLKKNLIICVYALVAGGVASSGKIKEEEEEE
jgi:hypothetical protein